MLRGCAGFAIVATACYRPAAVDPCTATCDFASLGSSATCPSGLTCIAPGLCAGPEGCGPIPDAAIDAPACRPDVTPLGHDFVVCLGPNLPPSITLASMINTDDTGTCEASDLDHCVIAANTISVQNTVRVTGSRPLVLAATATITVVGTLDASSRSAGNTGPSANWSNCGSTGIGGSGGGGGAGGSFQGFGGNGGGIAGGTATPTIADVFHGGCRGGHSALFPGADGGGAVYLVAGSQINVGGVVDADGAPGLGGLQGAMPSGGEGGGSGGFVGLDAPSIAVADVAVIVATGGGGGGGAGDAKGLPGTIGSATNGWLSTGGPGGSGTSRFGGEGGDGSFNPNGGQPGGPGSGGGGGGGGGGGAGYIHVWHGATMTPTMGLILPTPTS